MGNERKLREGQEAAGSWPEDKLSAARQKWACGQVNPLTIVSLTPFLSYQQARPCCLITRLRGWITICCTIMDLKTNGLELGVPSSSQITILHAENDIWIPKDVIPSSPWLPRRQYISNQPADRVKMEATATTVQTNLKTFFTCYKYLHLPTVNNAGAYQVRIGCNVIIQTT